MPPSLTPFDPHAVLDLYDEIRESNWALKSFGALLETANYEKRFCQDARAWQYKSGLNKIIRLYLKDQERQIYDARQKAVHSPERMIQNALALHRSISRNPRLDPEICLNSIQQAQKELDLVLTRHGPRRYPEAKKAHDRLGALEAHLKKELEKRKRG